MVCKIQRCHLLIKSRSYLHHFNTYHLAIGFTIQKSFWFLKILKILKAISKITKPILALIWMHIYLSWWVQNIAICLHFRIFDNFGDIIVDLLSVHTRAKWVLISVVIHDSCCVKHFYHNACFSLDIEYLFSSCISVLLVHPTSCYLKKTWINLPFSDSL